MPADRIEKDCTSKMAKAVDYLKQELRGLRTGRASPAMIEHIKIEVPSYGSTMELRELATISVPEPSTLMVKPFDPTTLKDIDRSLQASGLGITPISDGKNIRLPVPPLSGERRKQLVQQVRKLAEQQKTAVRNLRRDANKAADDAESAKTLSEDAVKELKDRVQKLTKRHEDEIDALVKSKTAEIEEG